MWRMEIVMNKMLVLSGVMKSYMSVAIVVHNLEQNDNVSFFIPHRISLRQDSRFQVVTLTEFISLIHLSL